MLDELLQKAVTLYVRGPEREAALITFRGLIAAAKTEGAIAVVAELTPAVRKSTEKKS